MAPLSGSSLSEDTFSRIKYLENRLRFIPTGAGKDGKAPLISEWSKHPGFTVQELQDQFPQAKSIGVITQPLHPQCNSLFCPTATLFPASHLLHTNTDGVFTYATAASI